MEHQPFSFSPSEAVGSHVLTELGPPAPWIWSWTRTMEPPAHRRTAAPVGTYLLTWTATKWCTDVERFTLYVTPPRSRSCHVVEEKWHVFQLPDLERSPYRRLSTP